MFNLSMYHTLDMKTLKSVLLVKQCRLVLGPMVRWSYVVIASHTHPISKQSNDMREHI